MTNAVEIVAGQIWKEVDPRQERHVRVNAQSKTWIKIETVIRVDGVWMTKPRTGKRSARRERFNGKRGGYALVG